MPDRADLKDHDADGVRHDVMQLARDAGPLFGYGDPSGGLPLPLRQGGAQLRRVGSLATLTQCEAGEPADREEEGSEDELAGIVSRIVVDDDRGPAEHDRQAEPRLDRVAE